MTATAFELDSSLSFDRIEVTDYWDQARGQNRVTRAIFVHSSGARFSLDKDSRYPGEFTLLSPCCGKDIHFVGKARRALCSACRGSIAVSQAALTFYALGPQIIAAPGLAEANRATAEQWIALARGPLEAILDQDELGETLRALVDDLARLWLYLEEKDASAN